MLSQRLQVISLVLISLFCCFGCTQSKTSPEKGIIYCAEGDPIIFNPQQTNSGTTIDATAFTLFNRLLNFDSKQDKFMPELATHWRISSDKKKYRFYLRKNVSFHSTYYFIPSRTMNADDVTFSFNRMIDKSHPYYFVGLSHYPGLPQAIKDNIQEIRTIDAHTVEFILKQQDASFLSSITSPSLVIHSKEYADYLLENKQQEDIDHYPIGTGPFLFSSYQKSYFIRYKPHKSYWDGSPRVSQLVFDITESSRNRLAKVIRGDCHITGLPKASEISVIKQHKELIIHSEQGMNTAFIALNTSKPPFNNVMVRKAIASAININNIIKAIYYYTADPANQILPPESWAHIPSEKPYPFDPDFAKAILKNEGINDLSFDLWAVPTARSYNPSSLKTAEMIQSDLAKVGIQVNIITYGWGVFSTKLRLSSYDAVLIGWHADNNDPDNFYSSLLTCSSIITYTNHSKWCNPMFDRLIAKAKLTSNEKKRKTYYHEAQKIVKNELPIIPIAHASRILIQKKDIKNIEFNNFGKFSLAHAFIGEQP